MKTKPKAIINTYIWTEKGTGKTINVKAKSEKESREVLSFLVDDLKDWEMKE